jgi:hypothetical protein
MTLKGYVDRSTRHDAAKTLLQAKHGADYQPPFGWDAFLAVDHEAPPAHVCGQCGKPAYEVLPYGADPFVGICEDCAALDPAMAEQRWREHHPNG